jgi:hypothetical protein
MKGGILNWLFFLLCVANLHSQSCIDTVIPGLTLLSKTSAGGADCLFSVKFCVRKATSDADHILYAVYHSHGEMNKTVDVSGMDNGTVVCETFTFVADCNSTASFLAVGLDINNSICGFVLENIVLPIRLLSFSGELQVNGSILLKWETASESNSSHFIVEESMDAKSFKETAKIKASGESRELKTYSLIAKANSGLGTGASAALYYRLKMVDLDGSYVYSHMIKLGKRTTRTFSVYPNPVSAFLKINTQDFQKEEISLMNLQGKEFQLNWIDQNTLDLRHLQSGIYLFKYQEAVIKIIKN